jgi:type VI secretion system protein ImpK
VLAIAFTGYYAALAGFAAPVQAELAKVGLEDFSAAVAHPVKGPSLKQLLAPDEANGSLRVEEQGGRTMVTLLAPDLFASGSATVNPAHIETLQRVTAALNKVPGRILVVGHTDDQPVRSFRFRDNFELSRERAVAVVKILQLGLENRARVSWTGVGSSEPRYRPETDPANRARNRRVEIVHRGGD